jgi:endogenous inhibitor of DNA gyrase (YacG/DUF329 family)
MTDNQKEQIAQLRESNLGYGEIAAITGLSKDAIKYYCKTHNLGGQRSEIKATEGTIQLCRFCGKPITNSSKARKRLYCSDECRRSWWKAHPEEGKPRERSIHTLSCGYCGKTFTSWGEHGRKFCSHACYIKSRFGVQK